MGWIGVATRAVCLLLTAPLVGKPCSGSSGKPLSIPKLLVVRCRSSGSVSLIRILGGSLIGKRLVAGT